MMFNNAGFSSVSGVMNQPVMQEPQEIWVQSLGQEDPLDLGMVTTPVFLPGEFHGQRSLAGHSP